MLWSKNLKAVNRMGSGGSVKNTVDLRPQVGYFFKLRFFGRAQPCRRLWTPFVTRQDNSLLHKQLSSLFCFKSLNYTLTLWVTLSHTLTLWITLVKSDPKAVEWANKFVKIYVYPTNLWTSTNDMRIFWFWENDEHHQFIYATYFRFNISQRQQKKC